MRKRRYVSKRGSRRLFSSTAKKVNRRNFRSSPMRGGIRF